MNGGLKSLCDGKKQNILKNSDVSLSFTQTYIHTNFCLQQNVILDLEILSNIIAIA